MASIPASIAKPNFLAAGRIVFNKDFAQGAQGLLSKAQHAVAQDAETKTAIAGEQAAKDSFAVQQNAPQILTQAPHQENDAISNIFEEALAKMERIGNSSHIPSEFQSQEQSLPQQVVEQPTLPSHYLQQAGIGTEQSPFRQAEHLNQTITHQAPEQFSHQQAITHQAPAQFNQPSDYLQQLGVGTEQSPFKQVALPQHNVFSTNPTDQLVAKIGVSPEDFSHNGYFEKMSSGKVFQRKTLQPLGWTAAGTSAVALGTTIPLVMPSLGAGAALTAGVAGLSTGAAIGTGFGAAAVGAGLIGYFTWVGRRTTKVLKGYKGEMNKIKQELMQAGNENAVRWYLRTAQSGSAKKKASKENAKTLAQLDGIQNPGLVQHKVYKIYVRHARNQNKVFLTRNPDTARKLINEANHLAEMHTSSK